MIATQVLDRGQDPAVVAVRRGEAELGEDAGDVLFHNSGRDGKRAGDSGVGAALGHQREHFPFPAREDGQGVGPAAGAQEVADNFGIEHGAALGHAGDRVDEVTDVGDAVLQQVADAGRRFGAGTVGILGLVTASVCCSWGFGAEDFGHGRAGCDPGWDRGERGYGQDDPGGGSEEPPGWRGTHCADGVDRVEPDARGDAGDGGG